jgi:hypothetical protein
VSSLDVVCCALEGVRERLKGPLGILLLALHPAGQQAQQGSGDSVCGWWGELLAVRLLG